MRYWLIICAASVIAVSCGSGSETVNQSVSSVAAVVSTTAAPVTTAAPPPTAPAGPLGEVEILLEPNGAQEASVSSAGLWTMKVAGTNWAGPPVYVLICTATDLVVLTRTGTSTCDFSKLQVGMPADGAFSLSFDLRVPEDGICIGAGDQAQAEAAGACISVGTPAS